MSHMTTESDDDMLFGDHSGSPLTDEGKSGGSAGGSTVLKKGPWTSVEDAILVDYVHKHGEGNWNAVQKHSRLSRCGKSCRLRWANHLRPNLKKGAFTPEEERLIIELHAKMGNKWARMAAHLPGRTDNEIKNYWNTRIKRRQRAGLPLYPSEVCLRQMQESQLNQNTDGGGQNDHLQSSSFEIPEVLFDCLKDTQGVLSYIPEIPCISTSAMRMNTLNPSEYYGFVPPIVHHSKRPRETATSIFAYGSSVRNHPPQFERQPLDDSCGNVPSQTFGSSFTHDPDPTTKNQLPFGINQGFHSLINGKFSASKPSSGASKLELPSLQYPETDFSSWGSSSPPTMCESVDAFIQSPARSGALHSDCPSPKNSGLLDALLHESKTLSSKNQQLSQKSQNSSALVPDDTANCSMLDVSKAKWEEYGDSISPLGNSETSIFSNCTPLSGTGSPLKENPPAETWPGSKIETEADRQVWPMDKEKKENGAKLDDLRPDSLLGSCFFRRSFAYEKEQGPKSEYAPPSTHDDLGNDHKLQMRSSAPNQGWGFGSCQWNNMPAVCQISEFT